MKLNIYTFSLTRNILTLSLLTSAALVVGCSGDEAPVQTVSQGAAGTAGNSNTSGSSGDGGSAGTAGSAGPSTSNLPATDKLDLLFMIDNSYSMSDKQGLLSISVSYLLAQLSNQHCTDQQGNETLVPNGQSCPTGTTLSQPAVTDIHLGVITSSMGSHGADICSSQGNQNPTVNDHARLTHRKLLPNQIGTSASDYVDIQTYESQGFLAWDPNQVHTNVASASILEPGEKDLQQLTTSFQDMIQGAGSVGCGYEASLESWYRFLIDPLPPKTITNADVSAGFGFVSVQGVDEELLAQRAQFLRPDSLVSIVMLTDENDCSIIDGQLPPGVDIKYNGNQIQSKNPWPSSYHIEDHYAAYKASVDPSSIDESKMFPINYVAGLANRNGAEFRLSSGTLTCEMDPFASQCVDCISDSTGPGCHQLPKTEDALNTRCYNQKKRFGVSMLYPEQRYVDGLSSSTVWDRYGQTQTNPLFDDLPYQLASLRSTDPSRSDYDPDALKKLGREKMPARSPSSVLLTSIVGVPWQDLAKDPKDLGKGLKTPLGDEQGNVVDWSMIVGDPRSPDPALRLPKDPLMIETPNTRFDQPLTHPSSGEQLSNNTWNPINGFEWNTGNADLQYSCIFPLRVPIQDSDLCSTGDKHPLCEKQPEDVAPPGGDNGKTQYRSGARPPTRILTVMSKLQPQSALVGSICAANVTDTSMANFGYTPIMKTLYQRITMQVPKPTPLPVDNN
jgi:hypothetical protein